MLRALSRSALQSLRSALAGPCQLGGGPSAWHQAVHTSAPAQSAVPAPTPTALDLIRARIFGTHLGNGLRSGRKVLRKRLCGEKVASWYMEPYKDPLFTEPREERRLLRLEKLRRRGKGPPKKGQGRRANKK